MDMDEDVYDRAISLVAHYVATGTQHRELNLAGIGESTIHPRFTNFVRHARDRLRSSVDLVLATNGIAFSRDHAEVCAENSVKVWVSLHRPERAGQAVELAKKYGILHGVSADPSIAAIDWAGQVDWHVSAPPRECPWLPNGWVMVCADGNITTCCLDASGCGVIGNVYDEPRALFVEPYSLCKNCDQKLNIPGYDQKTGEWHAS